MREITKHDLEGFWSIKPLFNCEFDKDISFDFRNNKLTINGTTIYNSDYEIINSEETKILKLEKNNSFLEIWMIMEADMKSLIINFNERRFYIEKRPNIKSKI